AAEVVDRDRVRMRELAGQLDLALESGQGVVRAALAGGSQELDRGRPAQQGVSGAVHRAHAAFADLLLEGVLTELMRALHFLLELAHAARREHDAERAEREARDENPEGAAN